MTSRDSSSALFRSVRSTSAFASFAVSSARKRRDASDSSSLIWPSRLLTLRRLAESAMQSKIQIAGRLFNSPLSLLRARPDTLNLRAKQFLQSSACVSTSSWNKRHTHVPSLDSGDSLVRPCQIGSNHVKLRQTCGDILLLSLACVEQLGLTGLGGRVHVPQLFLHCLDLSL